MLKQAILTTSLLLCSGAALACPGPPYPSTDACLHWEAATKYTDGSDITDPITYRVYRDGALVAETPQLFYKFSAEKSGNRCYAVSTVAAGVEGALTPTLCKVVRPAAPTDGSIEAPTDGSFEPEPLF